MSVWDDFLQLYQDPLFVWFPVATVGVSMAAFMLFALPLTAIAAADPAWARPYRIQSRKARPGVFWPSVWSWLENNLWLMAASALAWPILRLSGVHMGPLPPWYVVLGSLLLFVYLDDFLYYGFHRLMHRRWWFKRVHGKHHRIYTPWAITGNYMHPFEYVMTGTIMLVGPLLLGSHLLTIWLWVVFRQWEAAEGHCGYAVPWSPTRFLPFSDSSLHHDFHHSRVRGNYAGFLAIWDRVFRTVIKGYPTAVHAFRERAALGPSPDATTRSVEAKS